MNIAGNEESVAAATESHTNGNFIPITMGQDETISVLTISNEKFHQNGFKVKDVRMDVVSYNKKYFNVFQVKTYKYNRTNAVVNATINFKVAVKDKMEVIVQAYKFLSNEYRHFPIRFQVNVKKVADTNALGIKAVSKCGNVTTFSFEKDVTYFVCNFIIDETRLPPLIPSGRFKVDHTLLYENEEIAFLIAYGEVYTPIDYKKN